MELHCEAVPLLYVRSSDIFAFIASFESCPDICLSLLSVSEVFEPFLKAYIDKFKYKSITTADWKAFLYEFFANKVLNTF